MGLTMNQCKSLPCNCTNSIEDYDHPLMHEIKTSKYNIGYIGRLEKPFFSTILKGFTQFCESHPHDSISIVFFGGAYNQATIDDIKKKFHQYNHVTLLITGYMYPFPLKALQEMDLFVSGAGSAFVGAKAGVRSVNVDLLTYKPIGIISSLSPISYVRCPQGETVYDYLEWILVDKTNLPEPNKVEYENDWTKVCQSFDLHCHFIKDSETSSAYYDVCQLSTAKGKKKRFMRSIFGVKGYERLHKTLLMIKSFSATVPRSVSES